jgi:glycosyltransferase involved in cell wall biosynthesis
LDFSLITCTYNPDSRILGRCISALERLDLSGISAEFLIIDNNSTEPVCKLPCVRSLPDNFFKIGKEQKQGLSFARIAGFNKASGDVLIFVDDDNELDENYLQGVKKLLAEHPMVGAWGAGRIEVDFIDKTPEWIRRYLKFFYQERNLEFTQFGCVVGWPEFYPVGSGLVIRKEIFELYKKQFEQGILTAADRTGDELSSAGDAQIIWTSVQQGIPVGTSPLLKLKHIIPGKRTSYPYLKRLNYYLSFSYLNALSEMFPQAAASMKKQSKIYWLETYLKCLRQTRGNFIAAFKIANVHRSWERGVKASKVKIKP